MDALIRLLVPITNAGGKVNAFQWIVSPFPVNVSHSFCKSYLQQTTWLSTSRSATFPFLSLHLCWFAFRLFRGSFSFALRLSSSLCYCRVHLKESMPSIACKVAFHFPQRQCFAFFCSIAIWWLCDSMRKHCSIVILLRKIIIVIHSIESSKSTFENENQIICNMGMSVWMNAFMVSRTNTTLDTSTIMKLSAFCKSYRDHCENIPNAVYKMRIMMSSQFSTFSIA